MERYLILAPDDTRIVKAQNLGKALQKVYREI